MNTPTNPTEGLPSKKRMPKSLSIVIIEIAMLLGCVVAMFTVPRSTPISTFLIICAGILLLGNILLFIKLKSPTNPTSKVNYQKLYFGMGLMFLYWVFEFLRRRK